MPLAILAICIAVYSFFHDTERKEELKKLKVSAKTDTEDDKEDFFDE